MLKKPRGIRNNNPGNIEKGARWQGLALPEQMTIEQQAEPRFAVFTSPKWGIRALARLLMTYQARYGLLTIGSMIGRFAPPSENATGSYCRFVAERMGMEPDEEFVFADPSNARLMIEAIIEHENSVQPYRPDVLEAGLVLAGIEPPHRPPWPGRSRTTTGTAMAMLGTVMGVAADPIREAAQKVEPLISVSAHMKWIFLGLTVAGLAMATYARIDAAIKGKIG